MQQLIKIHRYMQQVFIAYWNSTITCQCQTSQIDACLFDMPTEPMTSFSVLRLVFVCILNFLHF